MISIEEYRAGSRELTLEDARRLTERIRLTAASVVEGIEKLKALVAKAKAGNVHEQLGYASWTAYLSEVLGETPMRLARDDRQEVARMLTDEGMSTRATAKVLGVGKDTVHRDLAGVANETPAPRAVTGNDGKTYTVTTKTAETITVDFKTGEVIEPPKPRRRPITDAFDAATYDLNRLIERLDRLAGDDRMPQNKEKVASKNLNDLLRAVDALQRISETLK